MLPPQHIHVAQEIILKLGFFRKFSFLQHVRLEHRGPYQWLCNITDISTLSFRDQHVFTSLFKETLNLKIPHSRVKLLSALFAKDKEERGFNESRFYSCLKTVVLNNTYLQ